MASPEVWGTELLVNTTTSGDQFYSRTVPLTNGGFVTAWVNKVGTLVSIKAQVFDAAGAKVGGEIAASNVFDVSTGGGFLDESLFVRPTDDGGFRLSYTVVDEGSGGATPLVQQYNAAGAKVGAQVPIGTAVGGEPVAGFVTQLANGKLLATWIEDNTFGSGPDTDGLGTFGQILNADGTPSGTPFLINTTTTGNQIFSDVAVLKDGSFVVTFVGPDGSSDGVFAQRFSQNGSKLGGEIPVNTTTTADQRGGDIAVLADGRYVVVWQDGSGAGATASPTIRGQILNPDGTPSGGEFEANTTLGGGNTEPAVTALADGGFLVAWRDTSMTAPDTSASAVRAQRFDKNGLADGDQFVVNTSVTNGQTAPAIATLADGRVIVSFTDASQGPGDTSGVAVRAQIFDPREDAVSVAGSSSGDNLIGTDLDDILKGRKGADTLIGEGGQDALIGGRGKDLIIGGAGEDALAGGKGKDTLRGGLDDDILDGGKGKDKQFGDEGADTFLFKSVRESKVTSKDVIKDFSLAEGDVIDLSGIDAKTGGKDNDFTFIGVDEFSGKKGELQVVERSNALIVRGDTNGDGAADFAIKVKGADSLSSDDFVL